MTLPAEQLYDEFAEEILSGFETIVMVSNFCEPECMVDGVKKTIFPPLINHRLCAFRAKLRAHLDAYCFTRDSSKSEESFTVEKHEVDEILVGCNDIVYEFNERVLVFYKQYREVLEPHYTESQWCAHNFLNAFVE